MSNFALTYKGFDLFESSVMLMAGPPKEVKRTFKERFFSRPWMPSIKIKFIKTFVPSDTIIIDERNNRMFAHPVVIKRIKDSLGSYE